LTNHSQLFFLHLIVIGQFLTHTVLFILLLLIVDDALMNERNIAPADQLDA